MYGSTQVESPICRAWSQICTQYRLGVRFVRACHLALVTGTNRETVSGETAGPETGGPSLLTTTRTSADQVPDPNLCTQ